MAIPVIHHSQPMPPELKNAVAALGNFDGYHTGHQAVGGAAIEKARANSRPAIIATFDPHPVRYFAPHVPPFRLTSLEQRADIFAAAGADAMLVFDFGEALAQMSAEDFVTELLAKHLGLSAVVTGHDFTFGKDRGGNIDMLKTRGAQAGLEHIPAAPVRA